MRYAYVIVTEKLTKPLTKRDNFQHHLLRVCSSHVHALRCFLGLVEEQKKIGFNVLRLIKSFSEINTPSDTLTDLAYMERDNETIEYRVERHKIS
jgi:hypothetical protein